MYVCICKGLTEACVQEVAWKGSTTAEALIDALDLADDTCCGRCVHDIQEFVAIAHEATQLDPMMPEWNEYPKSPSLWS